MQTHSSLRAKNKFVFNLNVKPRLYDEAKMKQT